MIISFDEVGAVVDTLAKVPGVERWNWEWEMGSHTI